jgi:dienelactone hydrolase
MRNNGSWRALGVTVATAWGWLLIAAPAPGQTRERLLRLAEQAYNQKQYAAGSDLYLRLIGKQERDPDVYYDAACCLASAGRTDEALGLLERAVECGWQDADRLASEAALKSLHKDPRWTKVRDKLAAALAQADARRPLKAALAIDLVREKSEAFPFSEYRRLVLDGKVGPGREGMTLGSGKWYELKARPDGWIANKGTTVIQADWDEPKERTVLLRAIPLEFITINGEEHYGGGGRRHIVPVRLKKGKNTILCDSQCFVELFPADFPFSFAKETLLLPDLREDETGNFQASVTVLNTTPRATSVTITAQLGDCPKSETASRVIPAMNSRIVGFSFRVPAGYKATARSLRLWLSGGGETLTVPLQVVGRNEVYRRTFVSRFDGMVRHYAVNPSSSPTAGQPILLSLHGAGWGARRTAQSYEQRSWCHIVCPHLDGVGSGEGTYRQTALEVLEQAVKELRADPKQVFLVGYSAGGHGVWQIASLTPGLFSGVGASAGWISIFTYNYRGRPDSTDPISKVFARAVGEFDVESRFDALASIRNVALLHGDKDQSVQVSEARRIKQELEKRRVTPFYHEQPGADHAWATATADQVDFPPLLEHLRKHARRGTGDIWGGQTLPRTWHDLLKGPLVAVYGTNGTAQENDAAHNRALMEMERCRIGYDLDCDVLPDTTPLTELRGKNVILYGSPSANRLWAEHPTGKALLVAPSARKATSWLILGERDGALWGAVGGRTLRDCRIAYTIDPTSSLYPFPDWVLLTRDVLDKDFQGVLGAGWFGRDGQIDGEHSAWR